MEDITPPDDSMADWVEFVEDALEEPDTGLDPAHVAVDPELPARLEVMRSKFLDRQQIRDLPPPVWLIEEMLVQGTLAWLGGPFNSAKSFLAIDWACCVATGSSWRGKEVIGGAGPVVMLTAEGSSGLDQRLEAWEQANGLEAPVIAYPWSIASVTRDRGGFAVSRDWDDFCRVCAELKPRLITLDTQARITVGLNENLPTEMAHYIEALQHLQTLTGATILTVHHGQDRLRGSTSVPGAADSIAMMKLTKPSGIRSTKPKWVELRSEKQKDAEDFQTMQFSLAPLGRSAVLVDGAPDWVSKAKLAASTDFDHGGMDDETKEHFVADHSTPVMQKIADLLTVYGYEDRFTSAEAAEVLCLNKTSIAARLLTPAVLMRLMGSEKAGRAKTYWLIDPIDIEADDRAADDDYDFELTLEEDEKPMQDSMHHDPKEDPEYDL